MPSEKRLIHESPTITVAAHGSVQVPPQQQIMAWATDGSGVTRLIRLSDILFGFLPSALQPSDSKPRVVDASWTCDASVRGRMIHLRTKTEVVRTRWKSVGEAIGRLGLLVENTGHGAFVNLNAISMAELDSSVRFKRVGFTLSYDARGNILRDSGDRPAPCIEWVRVSARAAGRIISRLT